MAHARMHAQLLASINDISPEQAIKHSVLAHASDTCKYRGVQGAPADSRPGDEATDHYRLASVPAEADTALCASCVDVLHYQGVAADHLHHLAHKGVAQLGLAGVLRASHDNNSTTDQCDISHRVTPTPTASKTTQLLAVRHTFTNFNSSFNQRPLGSLLGAERPTRAHLWHVVEEDALLVLLGCALQLTQLHGASGHHVQAPLHSLAHASLTG